jgi:outer membrane protein TolC
MWYLREIAAVARRCAPALALLALASCRNAADYRREADETGEAYLSEYQMKAVGRTEKIEIETPADTLRRRLMLDQNLLANDPASFGIRDIPTNLYWRAGDRLLEGGEDASLSVWKGGTNALEIGLVDAVRIAAYNSTDYKAQKESLFESALALDLADDNFRTIFSGALSASSSIYRDAKEEDAVANHAISHNDSARLGLTRKFRNGVRVTGSIMANVAGMLTGDRRTAWGSSADLSISIPLLRGSGELVNTESLTQAQRSFIYQVRAFEQYKRTFICRIESSYLALVLAKRQQQNQDEAFRRVIRSTRRSYRMAEASRMSQSQFEQAHQSELSSKARWIASCQSYEAAKDSFKMALGLPPDARIEPRESDLAELERHVGRFAQLELGPYDMGDGDPGKIELDPPDSVDEGDLKRRTDIAIAIAFSNRLDFVSCRDRLEDAQRKLLVAEDALRAEVTLGTGISNFADTVGPKSRREGVRHGELHPRDWQANPVLTVDLPIERRSERNAYRGALIAVESAVRAYQKEEDSLKETIRSDMRSMSQTKDNLQIQYIAMNLAERRVRNQEILLQAGRADMTVMLEAQDSLVSAKNSLYSAMISYKNQELALQRDLGLLDVSVNGTWQEADLVALGVLPSPDKGS